MAQNRVKIQLKEPVCDGRKITLSWEPNVVFKAPSYDIEYLDLNVKTPILEDMCEAYLPVCITLAVLGDVDIIFPTHMNEETLRAWQSAIEKLAKALYRNPCSVRLINGPERILDMPHEYVKTETALLLGGGSESLLALAKLLDEGEKPYLVSLWGSSWKGSELGVNRERMRLEDGLAKEFNLSIIRIATNFKDLIDAKAMYAYLKYRTYFISAAIFRAINNSLLYPVARQLGLKRIVSGNEKESSSGPGVYSLSSESAHGLYRCSKNVEYFSYLDNLHKHEIVGSLHLKYPAIAKYQYSCWRSGEKRWCLNCEKCLRNYVIFRIYHVDPATVEMDDKELIGNIRPVLWSLGWEIVRNKAVCSEWDGMYREALRRKSKDVYWIFTDIRRKYPFRKLFVALKSAYRNLLNRIHLRVQSSA